jgi:hypothetical protein
MTSARDRSDNIHAPAALSPEIGIKTDLIGGWVSPRSGLDAEEKRKSLASAGN